MAAQWYIKRQGKKAGPFQWEALLRQVRKGNIKPSDLIKSAQMDQWVPVSQVPGLNPAPSRPPPAPGTNKLKILAIAGGAVFGLVLAGILAVVLFRLSDLGPGEPEAVPLPAEEVFVEEAALPSVTNIAAARHITDEGLPLDAQDAFDAQTSHIYITMEVSGATQGTQLAATLVRIEDGEVIEASSIALSPGNSTPYVYFSPDNGWTLGPYRADIAVDGQLLGSVQFDITKAPEPRQALKDAIEQWWAITPGGISGDLLVDAEAVDDALMQDFDDAVGVYAYQIKTFEPHFATADIYILGSENIFTLEFIWHEGAWVLDQQRDIPTVGFDMAEFLGSSKDQILYAFGDPDQIKPIGEAGEVLYYDYLDTAFVASEGQTIDRLEVYGRYGIMDIYAGSTFDQIESWMGEPAFRGYDQEADAQGLGPYLLTYILEDVPVAGQVEIMVLAPSEHAPAEAVFALWKK